MSARPDEFDLASLTTESFSRLIKDSRPVAVIVSVGSVEPHGPHMSLVTDTVISRSAACRAARMLKEQGVIALIAPDVPYGVTECARSFAGTISVSAESLTAYLQSIVSGFLDSGVWHVCLVNNHLEPAHDAAVRASIEAFDDDKVSVACPLEKRWARTLSDEFKSGACHAGCYETSIMLASCPELVDERVRAGLPEVPISLSDQLNAGVSSFAEMGLSRAYAGTPADATAEHGDEQLEKLATMIATEILEAIARRAP